MNGKIDPRTGDRQTVARLLELRWREWPAEKIRRNLDALRRGAVERLAE